MPLSSDICYLFLEETGLWKLIYNPLRIWQEEAETCWDKTLFVF